MATEKDLEQDEMIRRNAEHIKRNEEALLRQTAALEQIRDHYFPKRTMLRRVCTNIFKIVGVIAVYTGLMDTTEWYWNSRKTDAMAEQSVRVAKRLFLRENDFVGAARFLEKAVELDSGKVKYRIALAYVKGMATILDLFDLERPLTAEERQRVDEIMAEATFLQETDPDEPMPYVLAAQAMMLRGERKASVEFVDKAVETDPENAVVRVSACAIHHVAGDVAGARAQIAEAERLDATLPLVHHWQGVIALADDHDAAKAKEHFAEVLRLAPRLAMGHAMMGKALMAEPKPDFAAARREFAFALAAMPKMTLAMIGIGETFAREGKAKMARIWFDQAIAQDANCMKALKARAAIAAKQGDWQTAIDDLTAAIKLSPFSAELHCDRAKARASAGDVAGAKADDEAKDALGGVSAQGT